MQRIIPVITLVIFFLASSFALAEYTLGPETIIQAAGTDLVVNGYSVPSLCDWNNDTLPDLIVGAGGGGYPVGTVQIFLNSGTSGSPLFGDYFLAQSGSMDLYLVASGCLGCAPCCVYWDDDARKDLIVGSADGTVKLYLNVATDEAPAFDSGMTMYYWPGGVPTDIDVGHRAVPTVVDWNSDGKKDLLVGAFDGRIHIFLNEGTDTAPVFNDVVYAQANSSTLYVPTDRSSPAVADLDNDGLKDLLAGNTEGQLLFYANQGTDANPTFGDYVSMAGDGVPIDLAGPARSRVSLCDWEGDGGHDVLIGGSDGHVRLYLESIVDSVPEVPSLNVQLAQPWPNPFNPCLTINFQVKQTSPVQVAVYSLDGKLADVLTNQIHTPNDYTLEWNGCASSGEALPSGTYFVRLISDTEWSQRKVMLVR